MCKDCHDNENAPEHLVENAEGERPRFTKRTLSYTGKNHAIIRVTNADGSSTLNLTVTVPKPTDEDLLNDQQRVSPTSDEAGDRAVILGKAILDLLTLGVINAVVDPCSMNMSLAATLLDNAVRNDHANCAKSVAMGFLMKNMLSNTNTVDALNGLTGMAVPLDKDGNPDFSRAMSIDDAPIPDKIKSAFGGKPPEPTKH